MSPRRASECITTRLQPIQFKSVDPTPAPGWGEARVLVDGRDSGNIPGFGMSAAGLELSERFVSEPLEHPDSDAVLLFTSGDPVFVFYGEDLRYLAVQHPGDVLAIRRGTPYAVNTGPDRGATGYFVRSIDGLHSDTTGRPDLCGIAQTKAAARLQQRLRQRPVRGACTVVPFDSVEVVLTPQGHRIRPLVDGRRGQTTPGMRMSVGGLDIPGGFIANPHRHAETDVLVLVLECGDEGALTLHGPYLEHNAVQHRGDLLAIPRGQDDETAHTVQNLSLSTPIRAYEFRSQHTVCVDNPRLDHLQPIARDRGREELERLHGRNVVAAHLASPNHPRIDPQELPPKSDWHMGKAPTETRLRR